MNEQSLFTNVGNFWACLESTKAMDGFHPARVMGGAQGNQQRREAQQLVKQEWTESNTKLSEPGISSYHSTGRSNECPSKSACVDKQKPSVGCSCSHPEPLVPKAPSTPSDGDFNNQEGWWDSIQHSLSLRQLLWRNHYRWVMHL